MARFAGLELDPILADSDDDDGDMGFRRAGWGGVPGGDDQRGKGNDAMTDTWQNEIGNIKVNDRGMRVAQRDGQEELLLEGQVVPEQLVFVDGRVIGRGACSVVNLARHKDTGQLFAVKVFSLLDREKRRQLDREIGTLLRSLENGCCSHLVDFFGAFKRPDGSIRVVLEFMDRGSLADVMEYRTAIQSRWNERRELEERQKREAAAGAAVGASNATLISSGAHGVSNGHARSAEAYPIRVQAHEMGLKRYDNNGNYIAATNDVENGTAEDDEEDDMPATLERLRDPHRRTSCGSSNGDPSSGAAAGGTKRRDANYDRNSKTLQHRNGGSDGRGAGKQAGSSRRNGSGVEPSLPPKGHPSHSNRLVVSAEASPYPAGNRVKPAPLTEGALATPAAAPFETKLERGRSRMDAPWVQLDDLADVVEETPAENERRRMEAEAEANRQREQEEWDRAFEEELMQTGLPEDVVAACVYQILKGLTYLHEHNQLHRDVKPSNILLNARGEVKLTDFGIARELDHAGAMVETVVGTVRYMSPERLHGEAYGRPADVWGLGLVMIECVTQEAPYADGCSQIEILQTLKEHGGNGLLPSGLENRAPLSDAFVKFVSDCLKVKPEDRMTTSELLDSPWFIEQGVQSRDEAVDLMAEYLEGLYGPHAFKYFGDVGDGANAATEVTSSDVFA